MTNRKQNNETKTLLAKLLAQENIRVEHSPNAKTAMYEPSSKTMILPIWKDVSEEVRDMLILHEVGHAIKTPADDRKTSGPWVFDAERIGGTEYAQYVFSIMQIVEDARIERFVKQEYPGSKRDFRIGYKELNEKMNFFGIQGKNLADLSLMDRINIHFKCGALSLVPFCDEEQKIVDRIATMQDSFDETVNISEEIFNFLRNQGTPNRSTKSPTSGDGDKPNAEMKATGVANSDGNSAEGEYSSSGGNGESIDKSNSEGRGQQGSKNPSRNNQLSPITTQDSFDDNIEKLRDTRIRDVQNITIGRPNLDRIILPCKEANQMMTSHFNDYRTMFGNTARTIDDKYNEFLAATKPLVTTLVAKFELRKAADIQKRTSMSKSGRLNPNRISQFQISDDIFLNYETVADGKNHGLVMFVDWSSSMQGATSDTINQVLILTQFCRRMNIPFEVYLFTTQYMVLCKHLGIEVSDDWYQNDAINDQFNQWKTKHETKSCGRNLNEIREATNFALINVLSSEQNNHAANEAMKNLFILGKMISYDWNIFNGGNPPTAPAHFHQGGTPLDSAIIAAMELVPQFQEKHKIQIVNTIFLTDGESGDHLFYAPSGYSQSAFATSPLTNKTYKVDGKSSTDFLLEMFREHTGSTTIGFFICSSNYCRYFEQDSNESMKILRNKGYIESPQTKNTYKFDYKLQKNVKAEEVIKNHSYDRLFILPAKVEITDGKDQLNSIGSNSTFTKIKNAFIQSAKKRNMSRAFLNRFAEIIADPKSR